MIFTKKQTKKQKVGIAFGGGGARGFAHLGVIKALYENNIKFDHVAGVSAGSVAAAAYCVGMPFETMKAAALKLKKEDILSSKLFFIPSDPKKVEDTFHKILGDSDDFSKCEIPLSILAVDIVSGCEHVFSSSSILKDSKDWENLSPQNGIEGFPISRAVSASCAVPGIFSPVHYNDMLLMDGGLMNNIPASVLRDAGCDKVVSIHVGDLSTPIAKSAGLADVLPAAIKILIRATGGKGLEQSDLVIIPELGAQKFGNIENVEALIEAGYTAAISRMEEIKQLFNYNDKD